jgi:hypothetical protein
MPGACSVRIYGYSFSKFTTHLCLLCCLQGVYPSNAAEAAILAAVSAFPQAPNAKPHQFPPTPAAGVLQSLPPVPSPPAPTDSTAVPDHAAAFLAVSGGTSVGTPLVTPGAPVMAPGATVTNGFGVLPEQAPAFLAVSGVASVGFPFGASGPQVITPVPATQTGLGVLPEQSAALPAVSGGVSVGYPLFAPPGSVEMGIPVDEAAGHSVSQQALVANPPVAVVETGVHGYAATGAAGIGTGMPLKQS